MKDKEITEKLERFHTAGPHRLMASHSMLIVSLIGLMETRIEALEGEADKIDEDAERWRVVTASAISVDFDTPDIDLRRSMDNDEVSICFPRPPGSEFTGGKRRLDIWADALRKENG